jgi:uncharacterized membrane protein YhaH (DUF805 family)
MRLVVATALLRDSDDVAGIAACAGCWGIFFLGILLTFVLQVALLVWVARDAKARGMDAAVVWMIFVFLVPVIGLLVYVFSRPEGVIVKCEQCHNSRLQTLSACPYCGKA